MGCCVGIAWDIGIHVGGCGRVVEKPGCAFVCC